jgi:hypothetical protein
LAASVGFYRRSNVSSLQGEASNNWAPNGIGYYLLSRLLWKADVDPRVVEEDFYQKAFGPAAEAIKRFYRRWETGMDLDDTALAMAYRDLQEATDRTAADPACRARVDQLRLYAHFLKHYVKPPEALSLVAKATEQVQKKYGPEEARRRIQYLGDFTRRLMDAHIVHAYPFNGFLGRYGQAMADLKYKDWQKPGPIPHGTGG